MISLTCILMGFVIGGVYGDTERNDVRFLAVLVLCAIGVIVTAAMDLGPILLK